MLTSDLFTSYANNMILQEQIEKLNREIKLEKDLVTKLKFNLSKAAEQNERLIKESEQEKNQVESKLNDDVPLSITIGCNFTVSTTTYANLSSDIDQFCWTQDARKM